MIRDAFVACFHLLFIRQRLLEYSDPNLDYTYSKARALEMAQLHSVSYSQSQSFREQNHSTNDPTVLAVTTKVCFFCRRGCHVRSVYSARNSTSNGYGEVGHFFKVCRSKPKQKSRINMIDTHRNNSRLTTVLLKSTSKHDLHIAKQTINVNGSDVVALSTLAAPRTLSTSSS
ncbi:hypothetical protein GJ496_004172 [Pomphorhynchus laevis]|nr:hypothetical protein GJ496_004172 [Pomphorhynchus laevis]